MKYHQAAMLLAAALSGGSLFAGTPVLTPLYSFTGASGAGPDGGLISDASGALYGATYAGGATNMGAVFQLTPPAAPGGAWTETTLYNFTGGADGGTPFGALVFDTKGALYGATIYGGTANAGTIFQLTPPAAPGGAWTETVLHNFTGASDGGNPTGSMVFDNKGLLYGTATIGGAASKGVAFRLRPPSTPGGAWTYSVLHSFTGGSDGASPAAGLVINGGFLFGTTYAGGTANAGTLFQLRAPATMGAPWTEKLLYSFKGGSDGGYPDAGLTAGTGGVFYGTTSYSGTAGVGVVFQLSPPTVQGGAWTETALYSFKGGADGEYPYGNLILSNNVLLGATYLGGATDNGALFQLKPPAAGGAWTESVLFSFVKGTGGSNPYAGLVLGLDGLLYGTTFSGGNGRDGTVFSFAP